MWFTLALHLLSAATAEDCVAEHLGQPCRARQINAAQLITDRHDGRPRLALCNMNEVSGMELVLVDFENDTAEVFPAPAGQGAWGLLEVPGDRLVISTFYDGVFLVFDLLKKEFVHVADFPGETYIWTLALGGDGRVYGGTYPNGKLGALDLDTYEVEDLGNPAPPNMYLRYVSALPDGRLYCWSGMEEPTATLYDPKTKEFAPSPEGMEGYRQLDLWNGMVVSADRAFDPETLTPLDPPYPVPASGSDRKAEDPDEPQWHVINRATNETDLLISETDAVYLYRPGDESLTTLADYALRGGWIAGVTSDGAAVGVRGQDYFVLRAGDPRPTLRRIPGETGPRSSHFIAYDGQGRVWGGPTFGQTLWHLDPETGAYENTGVVSDGGGEVYDADFRNGNVYLVSYVRGEVIQYDPDKPWDQWGRVNPKPLARLNARGYIRPIGDLVIGSDGTLYSGWLADYGRYGGAISITDPATGDTHLIEDPLGPFGIGAIAVHEGLAYVGTSVYGNGMPVRLDETARFGIIDLKTRDVVHEEPLAGRVVSKMARDARTGLFVMNNHQALRVFDPERRAFLPRNDATPTVKSSGMAVPGDGTVLYGHGEDLVRVDLETGESEVWATLPSAVTHVARRVGDHVYLACGPDVYRVPWTTD